MKNREGHTSNTSTETPNVRELEKKIEALESERQALQESNEQYKKQLEEYKQLEANQHIDHLTQVNTREAFDLELLHAMGAGYQEHRHDAEAKKAALLFIDVDQFKEVNDTHGHVFGDEVLKRVAACFASLARETDFVARIGGEEFGILLKNTDEEDSLHAAEKFRAAVEALDFSDTSVPEFTVTASFGIASSDDTTDPKELYAYADKALYKAKEAGRNQVQVYSKDDV